MKDDIKSEKKTFIDTLDKFDQKVIELAAKEAGIPFEKAKDAMITSDEWVELTNAAARISELN